VLDMPRCANQHAPHQEAEDAADQPDGEQQGGVLDQFGAGDAAGEIVDCVPEYDRRRQRHALRDQHAAQPDEERLTVANRVAQETPEWGHLGSIARLFLMVRLHLRLAVEAARIWNSCTRSTSSSPSSPFWRWPIAITARFWRR